MKRRSKKVLDKPPEAGSELVCVALSFREDREPELSLPGSAGGPKLRPRATEDEHLPAPDHCAVASSPFLWCCLARQERPAASLHGKVFGTMHFKKVKIRQSRGVLGSWEPPLCILMRCDCQRGSGFSARSAIDED